MLNALSPRDYDIVQSVFKELAQAEWFERNPINEKACARLVLPKPPPLLMKPPVPEPPRGVRPIPLRTPCRAALIQDDRGRSGSPGRNPRIVRYD